MITSARAKLDSTLATLRAKLLAELPAQVEAISILAQSIGEADARAVPLLLGDLERAAHGIAGRAALFDLPTVMTAAIAVERLAEAIARKAGNGLESPAEVQALLGGVAQLELQCTAVRASEAAPGPG